MRFFVNTEPHSDRSDRPICRPLSLQTKRPSRRARHAPPDRKFHSMPCRTGDREIQLFVQKRPAERSFTAFSGSKIIPFIAI